MKRYFFCGIGGSGMSSLAVAIKGNDIEIKGSDRSLDQGKTPEKFETLRKQGITLFPQDGSGIDENTDLLVVSSAVEETIPDVIKARSLNIPIKKRAEVLAELLHRHNGIAVAGTSGKTTTTGMTGHILKSCGLDPTVINGGIMLNYPQSAGLGNVLTGNGSFCVIEADESDGSIALYSPAVALVNSITLDHKPIEELRPLFADFVARASVGAVLNADCPETAALKDKNQNIMTYSIRSANADLKAENLTPTQTGISFVLDGEKINLLLPGHHNVSNALAALSAAEMIGIPRSDAVRALETFKGIHRRTEIVGTTPKQITVIDDFAHNPEKIAASLEALKEHEGRLIIIYQPHGFGPTRMMRREIVEAFNNGMSMDDTLIMPEIYYAGGTAAKDISSADLIKDLERTGKRVHFIPDRAKITHLVKSLAQKGDRIVVMGARDDTLSDFARDILKAVS